MKRRCGWCGTETEDVIKCPFQDDHEQVWWCRDWNPCQARRTAEAARTARPTTVARRILRP